LVGIPEGRIDHAVSGLEHACRSRVEYVASPFEGALLPTVQPIEVEVRGATVFVLDVERCEVI
jgi:uncharacterized protein YaaQ